MYVRIGQTEIVPEKRIIGIFDLDNTSYSKITRKFLAEAEKESVVITVGEELPRSFILCDHPYHRQIVYLSPLSSQTLYKRMESDSLLLD